MTPRTITGAHRIYVLPKERNKSEYVDYCAQSTTLVEALTKDSLVEHLIIKCSDPWGFVFPDQLVSQKEREKPLRITLLLTEHIDHVRGNLPHWEEFVARARTEGKLKGQVYRSGWEDCVVPRGVYVPSGLMTRIACRDKDKYPSNFPDPTGGGKQEDGFTYRFLTDASLAKGSTAEELAQIRAYFGVDLSHSFKPIRKIKNGAVTNTQADMWVYEFLYARQMMEAHGASSGVYMNMLYWLNASEANITDFWEVAETTEDTARKIEGKLDKPTNGTYVLDIDIPSKFEELVKVGGRNLLKDSKNTFSNGNYFVGRYYIADPSQMVAGEEYTIQIWGTIDGRYFSEDLWVYNSGGNTDVASIPKITNGVWKQTFKWRDDADKSNSYLNLFRAANHPNNNKSFNTTITKIKLERGNVATDWTPAPEDFLGELDTAKATLTTDIGSARKRADNAYGLAKHVNDVARKLRTDVNVLQPNVPTEDQKKWIEKMGQVLKPDSKESGNTVTINGLNINRSIFLRFAAGKPAAMIGGNDAVLTAGVSGYGTTNPSVRTAIYQNGAAKFGPVEMGDNGISVKGNNAPIVISGEMVEFIDDVNPSNIDKDIVSGSSITLNSSQREITYTIPQMNFAWGSTVTISIDKITCNVYQYMAQLEMLIDNKVVNSWRGDVKYTSDGGYHLTTIAVPLIVGGYKHECSARSGQTIKFRITSDNTTDSAQLDGIKIHIYNNTANTQTSVSYEGFRAYFDRTHYFDVYANKTKYYRYSGNTMRWGTNEYVARVKGGMRLDSLTLEQPLDAPGCVLAGGEVDSNGQVIKSFGRYKKKQGDNTTSTDFDYNTHYYTIYHSIGNRGYIPIVTSRSSAWADVPRVVSVSSNSFTIAFINEANKVSDWRQPFIYVCYKAD